MKQQIQRFDAGIIGLLITAGLMSLIVLPGVFAQGSSSSNFRIDESFVGPGGILESNSASYSTQAGSQALGNPGGAGEASSTTYREQAGYSTTNDPSLSFFINTSSINFGSLSTGAASTATATFSALNYTSYGYVVQIIGAPPTNNGYTLAAMSSTGPSVPGIEQFGINMVANTSPITFGADPVQVPSGSFSYGSAAANYNTANNFRYVNGETIATATQSSGRTDYTISYIVNASNSTAGGSYSGSQTLVFIGTY